ncbi:uncharacterized protein [Leptinotarsa decemlineata]|uniref:uncharacterized protein n=1 Tax=Leptinotarsa decemlineata TaxID=7539 RepID=UPI003D306A2D
MPISANLSMIRFAMVRDYVRTTNRGDYSRESLEEPVGDIKGGRINAYEASKQYGIGTIKHNNGPYKGKTWGRIKILFRPFKDGTPGEDWCLGIAKRNNLSIKKPQKYDKVARKRNSNPFIIDTYFTLLENTIKELGFENELLALLAVKKYLC